MTDRELLEAAARAAGLDFRWEQLRGAGIGYARARTPGVDAFPIWRPLEDDGDALRLAVKLGLHVGPQSVEVWRGGKEIANVFVGGADPYAATRRAIVRAAALVTP